MSLGLGTWGPISRAYDRVLWWFTRRYIDLWHDRGANVYLNFACPVCRSRIGVISPDYEIVWSLHCPGCKLDINMRLVMLAEHYNPIAKAGKQSPVVN